MNPLDPIPWTLALLAGLALAGGCRRLASFLVNRFWPDQLP